MSSTIYRKARRGGRTIPSKYASRVHNHLHIDIVGARDTMAAIALWNKTAQAEFSKRKREVEKTVEDSVKKVLKTGRSKSVDIPRTTSLLTQAMRQVRGAQQSTAPFKGTGLLALSVRATSKGPEIKHISSSSRKPLQAIHVTITGGPTIQNRAAAIIKGYTQTIDERHRPWIRMLRARKLPAPAIGQTMTTPPRDFIRAGVMDASKDIEKIYNEAVKAANAKTTMMIPVVNLKPKMTKFVTAKKGVQTTEVQRGIRGAKVDC